MAHASNEPSAASVSGDIAPALTTRISRLDHESERCFEYAARLSGWAMLWKIVLVVLGSLIAAQGAFVLVWGQANWISIAFIMFGILTALGSGFDTIFRPAERSPKFARMGYEYERLGQELLFDARSLMKGYSAGDAGQQDNELQNRIEDLARQVDKKLSLIREKELELYVTGPVNMVDPTKGRKKVWRRYSG